MGEFNYLGSSYQSTNNPGQRVDGFWVPQDPSAPQVRQSLTEYAILPLGSQAVREQVWKHCEEDGVKLPRSILLYGARGTGKSMLVEAVEQATGALFFNLSPRNLEGKFTEKGGATKLLHMVFTVAREPEFGPSVIYIDEAEKICANTGKKKTVSEGPARFKKDLLTYIASLTAAEAVVIIGCSSTPWEGDDAAMRTTFERHLHVPYPRYGSLVVLWREFLYRALKAANTGIPDEFDVSSLAHVSAGYSAGSILHAIKSTLTERRLERVRARAAELLMDDDVVVVAPAAAAAAAVLLLLLLLLMLLLPLARHRRARERER